MFQWLRRLFSADPNVRQAELEPKVWVRRLIPESPPIQSAPKDAAPFIRRVLRGFDQLEYPILICDTETTGVTEDDRIVSFGAIMLNHMRDQPGGTRDMNFSPVHFLFNPGRPSHPMAQKVHGHTDLELSFQEPFSDRATEIAELFGRAKLVVCHNVAFDLKFIRREMQIAGASIHPRETFCTMRAAQRDAAFPNGRLDDLSRIVGLPRIGATHGALEDAWITMHVFFRMQVGAGITPTPFSALPNPGFENYRSVSTDRPDAAALTKAPRQRSRSKKAPET